MPSRDATTVATIPGTWVSIAHSVCAYGAFVAAFIVGVYLHYQKIVSNEFFGYPEEWFPSVSATIGDWYPERNIYQTLIALTATPRFGLIFCWYLVSNRPGSSWPKTLAIIGVVRTFAVAGFSYVSSSDDHNAHDVFMISYILCTIPWHLGVINTTPPLAHRSRKYRKYISSAFFGSMIPIVYYFIQHKVKHVPGAYTIYAFWEWGLIFLDISFDSVAVLDFDVIEIQFIDKSGRLPGSFGTQSIKTN